MKERSSPCSEPSASKRSRRRSKRRRLKARAKVRRWSRKTQLGEQREFKSKVIKVLDELQYALGRPSKLAL
jgi:hypothetical protein